MFIPCPWLDCTKLQWNAMDLFYGTLLGTNIFPLFQGIFEHDFPLVGDITFLEDKEAEINLVLDQILVA